MKNNVKLIESLNFRIISYVILLLILFTLRRLPPP